MEIIDVNSSTGTAACRIVGGGSGTLREQIPTYLLEVLDSTSASASSGASDAQAMASSAAFKAGEYVRIIDGPCVDSFKDVYLVVESQGDERYMVQLPDHGRRVFLGPELAHATPTYSRRPSKSVPWPVSLSPRVRMCDRARLHVDHRPHAHIALVRIRLRASTGPRAR